ncbi:centrosomal protein of 89 kDa-like isoform X1 [Physella acuta]|uniref:centrosomal protein of 89 kDa-like isoform X1 n=1 Tax=Physella acuta TaxID=109671 RepID=UPI0027DE5D7F|nr:centrosomal protein of 89 kDa-like isoform X1 [Physella acuta]
MESKMVGKKGKKKSKEVKSAVVPSSAFAAVPTSVTAPAAMAPSTSGKTKQVASPRILGQPSSPVDEFSEPESSLFDYQQMDEAGYMTVGFGTWPTKGKQQRSGMQAQPQFRNSGSTGIYATPGDVEVLAQGDSSHIGNISDLYATPMKKKGKAKRDTSEVDGGTLSRTHQAVETEMKKIYNMTSEPNDTMKEVRAMVHHSHPGSHQTDSGRGSTRPQSLAEEEGRLSPDLAHISNHTNQSRSVHATISSLEAQPTDLFDRGRGKPQLLGNEVVEELIKASKTASRSSHMQTPRSMNRGPGVDGEVHQLRSQNEEMLAELHSLRRVAEAIRDGNVESAQALYLRRQMEDIKEENDTLKSTVHRLNVELSDCLAKYRPVDSAQLKQVIEINGLPSKGPVPSWLINKKYLAPLFLAYDDRLAEKDQVIDECKKELESLKRRAEEILKENQRLRMSGGMGLQANGTEWQQLQEQARLVLEENQVLLEQLQVQTNKSKEMHLSHMAEISRMAKKMALSEGERAEVERQLDEMRVKYREVKHKHDQMVMEVGSQVNVHTHINTIADLKRSVTEEKESFEREMDSLRVKLNASEEERRNQALQMVDLVAENKRLKAEVKAMQKSVKHAQQKMAVLHRAIELSEDKELITQEQLASVIKVAEKTALERDTVYKVAREHQEEAKQTVNRLMQGSVAVGKLEEKLKLYRMKASAKLNTVAERLKEQDEAFNSKKKEYEREIQYLRLLLKEKEEVIESLEKDKKDIEKDLDTMWQAASCENQRVKNILRSGPRKLRDQVHITDALKDEMENEELLHFSEDESSKL